MSNIFNLAEDQSTPVSLNLSANSYTFVDGIMIGQYGSITIDPNGDYIYTLDNGINRDGNKPVQRLTEGRVVVDSFVYTPVDTFDNSYQQTLTIAITGANDEPIAVTDISKIDEGSDAAINGNVLTNDTDIDTYDILKVSAIEGEAVTFNTTVNGLYGVVTINDDGNYYYNLNPNINITDGEVVQDSFVYTVQDKFGATADTTLNFLITGNQLSDVIKGSSDNDQLYGGKSDDEIRGNAGDDLLKGLKGNDRLYGGKGDDTLLGGSGHDELYGGSGHDIIKGQSGNDIVYGGSGNDTIYGNLGKDTIRGNSGDDLIYGGGSDDIIYGDLGQDIIDGGAGSDRIAFSFLEDSVVGQEDIIKNFVVDEDIIDLSSITQLNSYEDLTMQQDNNGDTNIFTYSYDNEFAFKVESTDSLSASDFEFDLA